MRNRNKSIVKIFILLLDIIISNNFRSLLSKLIILIKMVSRFSFQLINKIQRNLICFMMRAKLINFKLINLIIRIIKKLTVRIINSIIINQVKITQKMPLCLINKKAPYNMSLVLEITTIRLIQTCNKIRSIILNYQYKIEVLQYVTSNHLDISINLMLDFLVLRNNSQLFNKLHFKDFKDLVSKFLKI